MMHFGIFLLGLQLCFRRFPKDGFSSKKWLKEIDHRCRTLKFDISQYNPT